MKALLLLGCLALVSELLGAGVLGVLYGRQSGKLYMADRLIVGLMTVVGTAEAVHLAAVFFACSFTDAVKWFVLLTVALVLGSLGVRLCLARAGQERAAGGRQTGRAGTRRRSWRQTGRAGIRGERRGRILAERPGWSGSDCTPFVAGVALAFALLVIYQIVTISSADSVYRVGDMTVETVESFLETDGVYRVNPLTGQSYEAGVPLRIRILCLPTLYGILCRVFGLRAAEMVWSIVPLYVLLLSYLAFWTLARTLFSGEKDKEKRLLFIVLVAAVFCVGDYLYGMDGFGLLHCGGRGVTIRNGILLPYIVGLMLRHKWKPAVLCILAEACLVWTLYGMGACLLTALGMGVVYLWKKRCGRGFHEAGEEA